MSTADSEQVRIIEADGVVTVELNRPAALNAITLEMTEAFWTAATALERRDDLRCMVITATGRYFAAGIDLNSMPGRFPPLDSDERQPGLNYRRHYRAIHNLYDYFESIEKPVVAAVQGTCLGAGLEMALSCDFRFCTPRAQFGLPEVNIGILPGAGGSSRLVRMVGPAWAKYLAMAGKWVDAERALTIGLVQEIFPEEGFMDAVYEFVRGLMAIPPDTLGLAKAVIDVNTYADPRAQRFVERLANTTLHDSAEHEARIARFRKP
ncbi:enoyl-CoA hydratase/isomerase family protein [Phytohabitans sp. ZYX-F-186]|uniref:Enoyl-CoA hydratase/isomerase family protein n=1 Tax=Phytohabitans maris TaxID=3071409 RepID=A0ABU0ZXY3_9ACTN|nr:enoyl-CoA hydratase/isomerase family protein [Phytohabitans sp. ZYX-F-186]MDQ7910837.1 enoyl-CoA hydratase/isomerase family protein [Phytohabitans sp. ZYX-F-186]